MKKLLLFIVLLPVLAQAQLITTVAGTGTPGYAGNTGPATSALFNYPRSVAFDTTGNMYIADESNNVIRMVTPAGTTSTIAGSFTAGYSGDGGQATAAKLNKPWVVTTDKAGNIYIADSRNNVIRKVNPAGIISTIAGNGYAAGTGNGGYSGDGGHATAATMHSPFGIAIDTGGNIFIADCYNNAIRKVDTAGIIHSITGDTARGYSGDGGPATAAHLYWPSSLAFDKNNLLCFTDFQNNVIRRIEADGSIHTIIGTGFGAGTGLSGYSGDGGPATDAQLAHPFGLAIDTNNNIYFSDLSSTRIRKVNGSGIIGTIAGDGTTGYSGDGGPAFYARFYNPFGVTLDANNNLFIADAFNHAIRKITGPITMKTNALQAGTFKYEVYPNPAKDYTTLYFSNNHPANLKVTVTNLIGQTIETTHFPLPYPGGHSLRYDLSHYSPGIYFFTISDGNSSGISKKVVVQ